MRSSSTLVVVFGLVGISCGGSTLEPTADGGTSTADAAPIDAGTIDDDAEIATGDASPASDAAAPRPIRDGSAGDDCEGYDFGELETALDEAVGSGAVPGISFVVVRRGCGVLYEHSAGTYDADTVVPIASASKVPGMTVLMTLVDEGLIELDATVETYLGDEWPADKAAVTVRQLMSHTSGLPSMTPCLSDGSTTLEACAAAIASAPLEGHPGDDFIYGGADYQIAGRIAEVVSGWTFNELWSERIATPCGLARLSFAATPDNMLGSDTNPRVAGGAATNAGDYGRLLLMNLEDGWCGSTRVLSSEAIAEMTRNQIAAATVLGSPYDDGRGYGFGWWREPVVSGEPYVFSDAGAFGAKPWIDLGRGYGAFMLIRRIATTGERLYETLFPILERAIDRR